MPDPLTLLDEELASADVEGMREATAQVWGDGGAPSPIGQEAEQSIEFLDTQYDTLLAGQWTGETHQQSTTALDSHRVTVRDALDRFAAVGQASTSAADAIESAYTEAMIRCLNAATHISEVEAADPAGHPETSRSIAKTIADVVESVAERCQQARDDIEDLTPRVKALLDDDTPSHSRHDTLDPATDQPPRPIHAEAGHVNTTHVVVAGDTLWDLAARYLGDPTRWLEIHQLNTDRIADPDVIQPGQRLLIPSDPTGPTDPPRHGPSTPPNPNDDAAPPERPRPEEPAPDRPPHPDGGPPPPASPPTAPNDLGQVAPSHPPAGPPEPTADTDPARDQGTRLPSGAWVAAGLAVAVLAAWSLGLLRRRHHGSASYSAPPVPEPPILAALRRMLGMRAGETLAGDPRRGAPIPQVDTAPDVAVDLTDWAAGGLGLTGPGAASVARAVIAGVVCAGGPLATEQRGRVITTTEAMATLADSSPTLPRRLLILADAEALTRWLQVEVVRRRRHCEQHGAHTAAQLPQVDPFAEPLEPVLAVLPAPAPGQTHVLRAVLDEGAPYGVVAVVLGDWAPRRDLYIDGDGRTNTTRLSTMSPPDLRDALHVAAAAAEAPGVATDDDLLLSRLPGLDPHSMQPPTSVTPDPAKGAPPAELHRAADPDAETQPSTHAGVNEPPELPREDAPHEDAQPDIQAALRGQSPQVNTERHQPDEELAAASAHAPDRTSGEQHASAERDARRPLIRLSVFGRITLTTAHGQITRGLRTDSKVLLALLAANAEGCALGEIATALGLDPDAPAATGRCRTAITSLRKVLRDAIGDTSKNQKLILQHSGSYRLDPDIFDVDLWRMLTAARRAEETTDDATRLASLREAARAYTGRFATDLDQTWIDEHANRYHHTVLDALDHITEIAETDQPDAALAALKAATEHDPTTEHRYQIMMRIQGRLGRFEAVRRTLHLCHTRMAQIGAVPSAATLRVAARQLR